MRERALRVAQGFGFLMEEAEDVAQDVLLRLWAMHEKIGAEKSYVERLVSLMTRHACIDHLRMRHPMEDIERSKAIVMENLNQHDVLEYRELEEWIERQIDGLPTTCGIILRMRQMENREVEEIASLLGITRESVSTLLSRARHQLKKELERRNKR